MSASGLERLGYAGKTVVMTGGASGLGEAAARLLGELGATVHVADIMAPKVPHASFTPLDLSDFSAVRSACAQLRELGPIDFLFPVAGIPPHSFGPLHCMVVNYIGTRLFTEEMLPAVRDGGTVGLIASTAGRNWRDHLADHLETLKIADPDAARAYFEANPEQLRDGYSPSKELLIVWAQQVAIELGQTRHIRINTIAPCPIDTPFMEATEENTGIDFHNDYPYPLLGRMASAEEQAWSLLLLSSPLNGSVTGATLFTDQGLAGGWLTGALEPPSYRPRQS
ncbi:MAG: SDR family oxidoreductase [Novosphingobium sp.]|nr:SDR family oxidoreductase [Novosphingobium sp.]MCP5402987.1 SDR family oxidoreductase [Novosphingobium sp.]